MRYLIILMVILFLPLGPLRGQDVEYVGSLEISGTNYDVSVLGNYAFLASNSTCLYIIDVSNPYEPMITGTYDSEDYATSIQIIENYAYLVVTEGYWFIESRLEILDISDPSSPNLEGIYGPWGYFWSSYVSSDHAYLPVVSGDYHFILRVVDISDPSDPIGLGRVDTVGYAYNIFIVDEILYAAHTNFGLTTIDVSDPSDPTFIGNCDTPGSARAVFVVDEYAYVADGDSGLHIVDITDPMAPLSIGSFDIPGFSCEVFVKDNYVYICGKEAGLHIIDISNPLNPSLAGSYDTPGSAWSCFVNDQFIFVADSTSLMILRFTLTGIEYDGEPIPESFSLSRNYPNPFNAATTIRYVLPEEAAVTIEIYDILGRRIETLVAGKQPAGLHTVVWDAKDVSSGVYFYRIEAGEYSHTQKCVLLK